MDIEGYLEKAKELLKRDKYLMPVLFVETEDQIIVLGLAMDLGIDRKKMMMDLGKDFAKKNKNKRIKSISFIFDAWITRIDVKTNLSEKIESIVVSEWDIGKNKKDVITQDYEIKDNNVIWKGGPQGADKTEVYILEAFMQGYDQHLNYKLGAN